MTNDIHLIYKHLKKELTPKKLDGITAKIISAYKNKQYDLLKTLAEKNKLSFDREYVNKLFAQLIRLYHPDKIITIHNEIDAAYKNTNVSLLKFYTKIYSDKPETQELYIDYYEEYGINEEDYIKFGIHIADESEIFSDIDDITNSYEPELSFSEAVNKELCRDLGYDWNIGDLHRLEGDLELQGLNINDLSGIEDCINISSLNLTHNKLTDADALKHLINLESLFLSENQIEDLSFLTGLVNLKELDLSFNSIRDITPLLSLQNLHYVNLIGNSIDDNAVIEKLSNQNITVIN
ncbi:MAG: hypothetical protein DKM50_05110 [Candidatus Margulisiibacteriota bacterium]|nr:MAG: hypothetical protein A2X43_10780 [Candidatus Margulisbacteria bacterium GWD2_39_127]OGI03402.1 MAG: hypothetical protein A2X42_03425 [Candidatus Margulisbacteria bacterium GWF2_38_17]OGI06563.1 MAG: hypothetical protein A2X41_00455 [Candidatus Margulisbacteria bacterium GWE2_39_32]PZM81915.1 MAG: hypothetical protein DKM50_05110 [Candidatus Margulisiibacteriota bacterium]HAR64088.1 hypothetical protein [Candidatus Margulisiibacteriota bacterium]